MHEAGERNLQCHGISPLQVEYVSRFSLTDPDLTKIGRLRELPSYQV